MTPEFQPRYFDLVDMHPREIHPAPEEFHYPRHLTRVVWDDQIDLIIQVGDHCDQFALEELQRMLNEEKSAYIHGYAQALIDKVTTDDGI